ncbi:MAG: deoxynucleoside kinase [Anaerolineaceae bacterium]|jgi:deoxyguanosine kinase|nr:deoxynucleoside kinase [Anaerolineaceae bacterium]
MYFVIEGVIGVGKTTLARMLQNSFDAHLALEIFEENPFLSDFYSDRQRYAFQTQIFFLLSRYQQQRESIPAMKAEGKHIISDYTFDKDALFASINIFGDELETYKNLHAALAEKIVRPDLIVYLRASTETLMQRIALRDRSYERNMEVAYIEELNQAYDDFFFTDSKTDCEILTIDSNQLDYVRNPDDLVWIENRIRQTLSLPPYQPELPIAGQND